MIYYERSGKTKSWQYPSQAKESIDKPCKTIMASHNGMDSVGPWFLVENTSRSIQPPIVNNKPRFDIPSIKDIRAVPWNSYTVASTFSGCGGSCLGYRMAGFRILWANEFIPIAQESYNANKNSSCYLDQRDLREITADDILQQTNLQQGELDLLDGSPPCQAFSISGRGTKDWGKAKAYEHGATQCNELLFDEYIRLLKGIQPKVFVAENVTGLAKGTAKGMFIKILKDLKACGYNVRVKVLSAQWLGVPQYRNRLIFIGVRNNLNYEPVFPEPLPYFYSMRDALPELSQTLNSNGEQCEVISRSIRRRKFTIPEIQQLCTFPKDMVLKGTRAQQWERLGNSVPPIMMFHIAQKIKTHILDKL